MAIFAFLSKDTEELIFDQLCYNGEKYGKLLFWSYLPSWAKLRIKWYLAKFATLSKTVVNPFFRPVTVFINSRVLADIRRLNRPN